MCGEIESRKSLGGGKRFGTETLQVGGKAPVVRLFRSRKRKDVKMEGSEK